MFTKHIWLRLLYTSACAYVFINALPPRYNLNHIIFVPLIVLLLSMVHASFLVIQYHTAIDPKDTIYELYLEKYSTTFRFLKNYPGDFILRFSLINLFYFFLFRYIVSIINFITTPNT